MSKKIVEILKTIECFDHKRLNSEIVFKKMLSFYNKMTNKKVILATGVKKKVTTFWIYPNFCLKFNESLGEKKSNGERDSKKLLCFYKKIIDKK